MTEHVHTISEERSQRARPATLGADSRREPIDFGSHPDADLLRLCGSLVRLRDAQDSVETAIAQTEASIRSTPALNMDGRRMRELAL